MTTAKKQVDLKVIMLGPPMAGKTCFLTRYIRDAFGQTDATVGASFALKLWHGLKFGIWDTAGQEKYDSLSNFYCRNAGAVVLLFDLTDHSSFEELPRFVDKLIDCEPNCIVVVVGTKLDLIEESNIPRRVTRAEAEKFAETLGASYFESSSKTNYNVTEVFDHIGHILQKRRGDAPAAPTTRSSTVELSGDGAATKGKCKC